MALKKETSINCIPIEEVRNNFQNKVRGAEEREGKINSIVMKEMGTESDCEESEFTSESSKEEERKKARCLVVEPVISGRGTEALTRSEGSAKAINAELTFGIDLELTLKRVEVPELKEKRIQSWFPSRQQFIPCHPLPQHHLHHDHPCQHQSHICII